MPLSACASVPQLNPAAKILRDITGNSESCKLIGKEEVNPYSLGQHPGVCKERAIAEMKERVVALGGNAYTYETTSYQSCLTGGTTIAFEAYRCP